MHAPHSLLLSLRCHLVIVILLTPSPPTKTGRGQTSAAPHQCTAQHQLRRSADTGARKEAQTHHHLTFIPLPSLLVPHAPLAPPRVVAPAVVVRVVRGDDGVGLGRLDVGGTLGRGQRSTEARFVAWSRWS